MKLESCGNSYVLFVILLSTALDQLAVLETNILEMNKQRGRKGGTKTAERGPEYYCQIAALRKTRAGGRPKK